MNGTNNYEYKKIPDKNTDIEILFFYDTMKTLSYILSSCSKSPNSNDNEEGRCINLHTRMESVCLHHVHHVSTNHITQSHHVTGERTKQMQHWLNIDEHWREIYQHVGKFFSMLQSFSRGFPSPRS